MIIFTAPIHEMGHIIASKALGVSITEVHYNYIVISPLKITQTNLLKYYLINSSGFMAQIFFAFFLKLLFKLTNHVRIIEPLKSLPSFMLIGACFPATTDISRMIRVLNGSFYLKIPSLSINADTTSLVLIFLISVIFYLLEFDGVNDFFELIYKDFITLCNKRVYPQLTG